MSEDVETDELELISDTSSSIVKAVSQDSFMNSNPINEMTSKGPSSSGFIPRKNSSHKCSLTSALADLIVYCKTFTFVNFQDCFGKCFRFFYNFTFLF